MGRKGIKEDSKRRVFHRSKYEGMEGVEDINRKGMKGRIEFGRGFKESGVSHGSEIQL